MNDNLSLRIDLLYCLISSLREASILVHVQFGSTHVPQKSMCGFVAHLHPPHIDATRFEQLQGATCVVGKGELHLLITHVFPRVRDILFVRIGPPVTVMEIYHDCHAQPLSTQGHDQHIDGATEPVFWIDPHTQPHCIESQFAHEFSVLSRFALGIVQLYASSLQFGGSTNIGSQPEVACHCMNSKENHHCQ